MILSARYLLILMMKQVYDEENECFRWGNTDGTTIEVEGDDGVHTEVESLPLDEEKKFLGVQASPEGGRKAIGECRMRAARIL